MKDTLSKEHMRAVHADGSQCSDGCAAPVHPQYSALQSWREAYEILQDAKNHLASVVAENSHCSFCAKENDSRNYQAERDVANLQSDFNLACERLALCNKEA